MSGFFGSTFTSAKSEPRPETRFSELTRFQLSPASSERKRPPAPPPASTTAYIRFPSLGATAMPILPRPSSAAGSPFDRCRQFVPPSVDTKSPLPAALYSLPYSQGPCRADQRTA